MTTSKRITFTKSCAPLLLLLLLYVIVIISLIVAVDAHPEKVTSPLPPLSTTQQQVHNAAQQCQLRKKQINTVNTDGDNAGNDGVMVADAETTQGPFYITNSLIRSDVREGHDGIHLRLNIQVMDVNTCEPLPNAAVEIWSCDSKGYYSSFTGYHPDTLERIVDCLPNTPTTIAQPPDNVDLNGMFADTTKYGKTDDGGNENEKFEGCMTDLHTFLRGVQFVNHQTGVVTFDTIIPNYYISRTAHYHIVVFTGGNIHNVKGKLDAPLDSAASKDGQVLYQPIARHIGQLFFNNNDIQHLWSLDNQTYPTYQNGQRPIEYTLLENDFVWQQSKMGLINPIPQTTEDNILTDGLTADVIVYVNSTYNANLHNIFYLWTDDDTTSNMPYTYMYFIPFVVIAITIIFVYN